MGKLVVTEFVSVDGVFEDPGGAEGYEHGGWTFEYDRGDDGNKFKVDELMEAEVQLLGRVTYEGFAAAWPSREGPFAEKLNSDPKVVVSTTLTDPEWENTTVISDDVVAAISKLKDETGEEPDWEARAFPDLDQDVRDSIKLITESPFIPNKGSVRGFVYDVETGALREVSPA